MRTRHISCFPFHAIAIMLLFVFCARAKEATFKSSLPKQPINVVLPVGETLQVTLPRGFLDADLPDGEYDVEDVMEEYEWEVPGTPARGHERTATVVSTLIEEMASARLPAGDYRLVFTGKATYYKSTEVNGRKIRQGPFEVFLTASSGGRLELPFSFVKVTRLECGGVTVTDNPNDHIIHRLRIPCGYYGTGRITATATPSSLEWPLGYPVWGGEILSSYDGTAQVDVSSPGHSTLSATCGNTLSMDVSVIGVNDLLAAVVPQNTNLSSYWRSHYTSGVQEGYIESGSFKGNDEHKYLFLEVQDAWLTVLAEPTPDAVTYVLTNGSNLPSAWTFTGGQGNSKVIRHIDASVPGVTRFHAQCGTSERRLTIGIAGVDIRGDVNHDGQITAADNGRVVNQDGTEGAYFEDTRPGVLLTVPSPDDTNEEKTRRFAEIRLTPIGLQAISDMEENQTPYTQTPTMSLDYDTSRVEVFDAKNNGHRIEPGQPLPHHSELTVYARGVRPRRWQESPCRITVNYHSRLHHCSDSLVVTVLDLNPTMANGGFLLVNDDNDDMENYPDNATAEERRKPANCERDLDQENPQNWSDDDLKFASFPFDISELHDELCQCTVTFSMEGSGGVNVFSDEMKSHQMLVGLTATECEAVNSSGMLAVHYPNSADWLDTLTGDLKVAIEGTARSGSVKGTRLVATWKVGQVELRGILPLTVLQMQMAVDGGKHEDIIRFNDYGSDNEGDFGNYRCVFWANTDSDIEYYNDEPWPEPNAWVEDDGASTLNCNDDTIGIKAQELAGPPLEVSHCLRDLEDFNRLHIKLCCPLDANSVQFTLKTEGPSINVFEAVNSKLSYLKEQSDADDQVIKTKLIGVSSTASVLPTEKLHLDGTVSPFIWEACSTGTGDLELELKVQVGSNLVHVGTRRVELVILPMTVFRDIWHHADDFQNSLNSVLQRMEDNRMNIPVQASQNYLLIVHGFNVTSEEKTSWADTAFKRLWWQGFKGRVGFFCWDTLGMDSYEENWKNFINENEYCLDILDIIENLCCLRDCENSIQTISAVLATMQNIQEVLAIRSNVDDCLSEIGVLGNLLQTLDSKGESCDSGDIQALSEKMKACHSKLVAMQNALAAGSSELRTSLGDVMDSFTTCMEAYLESSGRLMRNSVDFVLDVANPVLLVRTAHGLWTKVREGILLYDDSEKTAWTRGARLCSLLSLLNAHQSKFRGKVSVLAHSLGNVVTGEALRQLPDNLMVKDYIASQAAIAGSFYEKGLPEYRQPNRLGINNYGQPDIYTSFPASISLTEEKKTGSGVSFLAKVLGQPDNKLFRKDNNTVCSHMGPRRFNLYNPDDYALHSAWLFSWESNNANKPDASYWYRGPFDSYDENASPIASAFLKGALYIGTKQEFGYSYNPSEMKDTYDIFSYAARARAKPLGAQPVNPFSSTNLKDFGYDKYHYSHSRQFRSNIIAEKHYWKKVKVIVEAE